MSLIAVLTLCLGASTASASIIVSDDFQSDTVGSPPAGAWTTAFLDPSTFLPIAGATENVALDVGTNQVLQLLDNSSTSGYISAKWEPFGPFGSQTLGAEQWQLKVNTNAGGTPMYIGNQNGIGPYFLLVGNQLSVGSGAYTTTLTTGQWYTLTVYSPNAFTGANLPVDYYIDSALVDSTNNFSPNGYNPTFQIFSFPAITQADIMVDNVKFGESLADVGVPEPASMSLLVIGGTMLLKRGRR